MKFPNKSSHAGMEFLKLKPGDSVRGVFRGEPYSFKQHWSNTNKSSTVCIGEDCPICSKVTEDMSPEERKKYKPSFRFRLNLITKENEAYTVKVFEQGWTVYETLKALHEGDYDLEKHMMKITRHGSGKETTYSIVPVPNGSLNEEQLKQLSEFPLINLDGMKPQEEEEVPF